MINDRQNKMQPVLMRQIVALCMLIWSITLSYSVHAQCFARIGKITHAQTWGAGANIISPFMLAARQYYIIYNAQTGGVHFDAVLDGGRGYVTKRELYWHEGFTHIVPFVFNNENYFIVYNKSTGGVTFNKVNSDGAGNTILWVGQWSSGWSHFVVFTVNNYPHLIAYNSDSGLTHIDKILGNFRGVAVKTELQWEPGFTHLSHYYFNGENRMIAYNSRNGVVHFDRILDKLNGVDVIKIDHWAAGWTHIVPVTRNLGKVVQMIVYNAHSGEVHLDNLGDGYSIIETSQWRPGMSHVVPVHMNSVESDMGVLTYNTTTGEHSIMSIDVFDIPDPIPGGSYQRSCKDICSRGGRLTANCRNRSGDYRPTNLSTSNCYGDIANINGQILCHRWQNDIPSGSYQASCVNIHVESQQLRAYCPGKDFLWFDGRWRNTSLQLPCSADISNIDGGLTCGGPKNAYAADSANGGTASFVQCIARVRLGKCYNLDGTLSPIISGNAYADGVGVTVEDAKQRALQSLSQQYCLTGGPGCCEYTIEISAAPCKNR